MIIAAKSATKNGGVEYKKPYKVYGNVDGQYYEVLFYWIEGDTK